MKLQLLFLTLGNQPVNHFEFIVPRGYKADGPAYWEALISAWQIVSEAKTTSSSIILE